MYDEIHDIKSMHTEYNDLVALFSQKKIERKYASLVEMMEDFIAKLGVESDALYLNRTILAYAVLDYFSDVARIKKFHNIERINETKIFSYEAYWIIKRKPIQVKSAAKNCVSINEKSVLSMILHYLIVNDENAEAENLKSISFFAESFFYYLKYRAFDAQAIELALLAFKAGVEYKKLLQVTSDA